MRHRRDAGSLGVPLRRASFRTTPSMMAYAWPPRARLESDRGRRRRCGPPARRIWALTPLPVLGVLVESAALKGQDSLLFHVQMPAGIPVGTLAIGRAGAPTQPAGRQYRRSWRCQDHGGPGALAGRQTGLWRVRPRIRRPFLTAKDEPKSLSSPLRGEVAVGRRGHGHGQPWWRSWPLHPCGAPGRFWPRRGQNADLVRRGEARDTRSPAAGLDHRHPGRRPVGPHDRPRRGAGLSASSTPPRIIRSRATSRPAM
jgi:hypothetical protein